MSGDEKLGSRQEGDPRCYFAENGGCQFIALVRRQSEVLDTMDTKFETLVRETSELTTEATDRMADKICAEIKELRTALVQPATGVGKVDVKIIMPIIYTLCGVICALIVWFTGVRPFLPGLVSGAEHALQQVEAPLSAKWNFQTQVWIS
jgi:hypothetical protein